jgi:hypothetical protein
MALPGDPKQRLSVLMKRLQAERGVPGLDTKPTQELIADTQRQIVDMENRAHQDALLAQGAERNRIARDRANRPRGTGSGKPDGSVATPAEDAVYAAAMAAKTPQEAVRIIGNPHNGLTSKQRSEMLTIVKDSKPDKTATKQDPKIAGQVTTLRNLWTNWSLSNPNATRDQVQKWVDGHAAGYSPEALDEVIPGFSPARSSAPAGSATPAPHAAATAAPRPANTPAPSSGGDKRTVSLTAAMNLPSNQGKSAAQVRADIEAHGYTVAP